MNVHVDVKLSGLPVPIFWFARIACANVSVTVAGPVPVPDEALYTLVAVPAVEPKPPVGYVTVFVGSVQPPVALAVPAAVTCGAGIVLPRPSDQAVA